MELEEEMVELVARLSSTVERQMNHLIRMQEGLDSLERRISNIEGSVFADYPNVIAARLECIEKEVGNLERGRLDSLRGAAVRRLSGAGGGAMVDSDILGELEGQEF